MNKPPERLNVKQYLELKCYVKVADVTIIQDTIWEDEYYVGTKDDGGFIKKSDIASIVFKDWKQCQIDTSVSANLSSENTP